MIYPGLNHVTRVRHRGRSQANKVSAVTPAQLRDAILLPALRLPRPEVVRVYNKIRAAARIDTFILFKHKVEVTVQRLERSSGDINPRLLSIKQLFNLNWTKMAIQSRLLAIYMAMAEPGMFLFMSV